MHEMTRKSIIFVAIICLVAIGCGDDDDSDNDAQSNANASTNSNGGNGSNDDNDVERPPLHGVYSVTSHTYEAGGCGDDGEALPEGHEYVMMDGSITDTGGFYFHRYDLIECDSDSADDCHSEQRIRHFELEDDFDYNEGVILDTTGSAWHESGGGECTVGWVRTILEVTSDGIRVTMLEEETSVDENESDTCRANEETAHLLDGSCAEAEILEATLID